MDSKVSVIIPTKNRASLIEKSIRSIFNQDYPNLEIIVSNNNSNDNTKEVLNEIKKDFKDLIILNHREDLSLNKHWDIVIRENSSGKYLMIIPDDDELIDSHYISEAVKIMEKDATVGVVFANYQIVNISNRVLEKIEAKFPTKMNGRYLLEVYKRNLFNLKGIGIPHLTAVFRRSSYFQTHGFDLNCLSPDTHLWLKILSINEVGVIEKNVASYLVHENNLSNTRKIHFYLKDLLIVPNLLKFLITKKIALNISLVINLLRIEIFFLKIFISNLKTHFLK
jgi:glycosyltransferase involved in cell wall biosynthesis